MATKQEIGGEGGIRTHVPVTRQHAFEARPLRPLRYLSASVTSVKRTLHYSAHLFSLKNACISARHSSSRTPLTTSNRWLWPGRSRACTVDTIAPVRVSAAP